MMAEFDIMAIGRNAGGPLASFRRNIRAGVVPNRDGNTCLYINVYYSSEAMKATPSHLLAMSRAEVIALIAHLDENVISNVDGCAVSLFVDGVGDARPCRLYRKLFSFLPPHEHSWKSTAIGENSQFVTISDLIQQGLS
jgi:hypothetical protein